MIKYPLSTEKSIRQMESDNILVFIVDRTSNKPDIKKEVEKAFNAKVVRINTLTDTQGRKKAYVKFSDETPAIDIATKLGLM